MWCNGQIIYLADTHSCPITVFETERAWSVHVGNLKYYCVVSHVSASSTHTILSAAINVSGVKSTTMQGLNVVGMSWDDLLLRPGQSGGLTSLYPIDSLHPPLWGDNSGMASSKQIIIQFLGSPESHLWSKINLCSLSKHTSLSQLAACTKWPNITITSIVITVF